MKLLQKIAVLGVVLVCASAVAEARPNWFWKLVQKKAPVRQSQKSLLDVALFEAAISQHPGAEAFNSLPYTLRNMIDREIKNSYFPELSKNTPLSDGMFELERELIAEKAGMLALKIHEFEANPTHFNKLLQHVWLDESAVMFAGPGANNLIPQGVKVFFIQGNGETKDLNKMAQLFFAQFQTAPETGLYGHAVYQVTSANRRQVRLHTINFENEGGLVNLVRQGAWAQKDVFNFDKGGGQFLYDLGYLPGTLNLSQITEQLAVARTLPALNAFNQQCYTYAGRKESAEKIVDGIKRKISRMDANEVLFIVDRNIPGRVKTGSIPMMLNEPGSVAKDLQKWHRVFVIKFTDRLTGLERYILSKSGVARERAGNVEIVRAKGKAARLLGFNLLVHPIQ